MAAKNFAVKNDEYQTANYLAEQIIKLLEYQLQDLTNQLCKPNTDQP